MIGKAIEIVRAFDDGDVGGEIAVGTLHREADDVAGAAREQVKAESRHVRDRLAVDGDDDVLEIAEQGWRWPCTSPRVHVHWTRKR